MSALSQTAAAIGGLGLTTAARLASTGSAAAAAAGFTAAARLARSLHLGAAHPLIAAATSTHDPTGASPGSSGGGGSSRTPLDASRPTGCPGAAYGSTRTSTRSSSGSSSGSSNGSGSSNSSCQASHTRGAAATAAAGAAARASPSHLARSLPRPTPPAAPPPPTPHRGSGLPAAAAAAATGARAVLAQPPLLALPRRALHSQPPPPSAAAPPPAAPAPASLHRHLSVQPSAAAPPSAALAPAPVPLRRHLSVQPEAAVYTGPSPRNPARVTLRTIRKKYDAGDPLTMVTAYDYPSAVHVDAAGIDLLLVGDSVAMVVHGHDTTLPITLEEMLTHCKAAARGARRAFLVGDLPFGCYETDVRDAVRSAVRMLKEGGMDAVKLEGGSPARVEAARAIVETGVAVMGHVGLTPQSVSVIGGFRPQAQVAEEALRVLDQAQALQRAGCFALVLECIPGPIAAAITRALTIPTIGIGAGAECSGQVLVYHDLLGMMSHPHHAKVTPKFCKQYAAVGQTISSALQQYRQEVEERAFPGPRFSPYSISAHEVHSLAAELRRRGMEGAAEAVTESAHRAAEAKAEAKAAAAAGAAGAAGGEGGGGGGGR